MTTDRELRVAVVQESASADGEANRERLASIVPAGADLVVLPEAFAHDFGESGSDLSAHAEALGGPFDTALTEVAVARGATVVAGMFEASDEPARPYNTLLVRGPAISTAAAEYRKIHLYDSFGYRESDSIRPGPVRPAHIEVGGFRVGLMTCYDLRFPELARALVDEGAEVLVVPAAWVAGPRKVDHWTTLVRARAIENTCYVIAAGQPGPRYTGHSMIVDPLGVVIAEAGVGPDLLRATLTGDALHRARSDNPALSNRRLTITATTTG